MRTVTIDKTHVAKIDDEDFERVSQFIWRLKTSSTSDVVYAGRMVTRDGKPQCILLHRFIMNADPSVEIDHRNGDGLDCQKGNLRIATRFQNSRNRKRHKNNKSGYKGVYLKDRAYGRRLFAAQITFNKKRFHVGYFTDKVEAARAYDAAAIRLHGEFARLNFPNNA